MGERWGVYEIGDGRVSWVRGTTCTHSFNRMGPEKDPEGMSQKMLVRRHRSCSSINSVPQILREAELWKLVFATTDRIGWHPRAKTQWKSGAETVSRPRCPSHLTDLCRSPKEYSLYHPVSPSRCHESRSGLTSVALTGGEDCQVRHHPRFASLSLQGAPRKFYGR